MVTKSTDKSTVFVIDEVPDAACHREIQVVTRELEEEGLKVKRTG